jgi:hypothetical protein
MTWEATCIEENLETYVKKKPDKQVTTREILQNQKVEP